MQFIVVTVEIALQVGMMFKSFVGLADRPNALIEIVLYLSIPNDPLPKVADVLSLIIVSPVQLPFL